MGSYCERPRLHVHCPENVSSADSGQVQALEYDLRADCSEFIDDHETLLESFDGCQCKALPLRKGMFGHSKYVDTVFRVSFHAVTPRSGFVLTVELVVAVVILSLWWW